MDTQTIEILESVPGHVRLRIPELIANPSRAQEVRACLDAYPGVESVRANFLTGSLAIDFNIVETAAVIECLEQLWPLQGLGEQLALRRAVVPCAEDLDYAGDSCPTREEVRARAAAKRRRATVGVAAALLVAGIVARRLLIRQ